MAKSQQIRMQNPPATQDLLAIIKSIAYYLKCVLRILLVGALDFGISEVQRYISDMKYPKSPPKSMKTPNSEHNNHPGAFMDCCRICDRPIEVECASWGQLLRRQHLTCESFCVNCHSFCSPENLILEACVDNAVPQLFCVPCSYLARGKTISGQRITKLQQYVFLLRVANTRLSNIFLLSKAPDNLQKVFRPLKISFWEGEDDGAHELTMAEFSQERKENYTNDLVKQWITNVRDEAEEPQENTATEKMNDRVMPGDIWRNATAESAKERLGKDESRAGKKGSPLPRENFKNPFSEFAGS
jgi:hypothetical protein